MSAPILQTSKAASISSDCLQVVAIYSDFETMLAIRSTCLSWRQVLHKDSRFWQSSFKSDFPDLWRKAKRKKQCFFIVYKTACSQDTIYNMYQLRQANARLLELKSDVIKNLKRMKLKPSSLEMPIVDIFRLVADKLGKLLDRQEYFAVLEQRIQNRKPYTKEIEEIDRVLFSYTWIAELRDRFKGLMKMKRRAEKQLVQWSFGVVPEHLRKDV